MHQGRLRHWRPSRLSTSRRYIHRRSRILVRFLLPAKSSLQSSWCPWPLFRHRWLGVHHRRGGRRGRYGIAPTCRSQCYLEYWRSGLIPGPPLDEGVANIECLATISSRRCMLPFANAGEAYWEHYFACKVDQLRSRFPLMPSLSKRQKWI